MIGFKETLSHSLMTTLTLILTRIQPLEEPIIIFLKRSLLQMGVGVVGMGVEARVEECRFKERLVVSLCKFSASKLYHNEAFFRSFFQP